MIGGAGEKKTLRIVARYADMWNVFGTPETVAHKDAVLRERCEDVGRDPDNRAIVGCKVTIRDTAAEAERVRRAPSPTTGRRSSGSRATFVLDRHAEQIAETILELPEDRVPHVHRRAGRPV